MKKIENKRNNFFKKKFTQICRWFGYELIDQSNFTIATKNQSLSDQISMPGKKSITLPMGEIPITRKVNSLHIILRICTKITMLTQSKSRLFEENKNEYTLRSLNSILKSIMHAKNFKIPIKLTIIDSGSYQEDLNVIDRLLDKYKINKNYIELDMNYYKNKVDHNASQNQQSNMANILKSLEIAKSETYDLIYFVEDDYIHEENSITEMLFTYEKISSLAKEEIVICPADYPYLYHKFDNTKILLGEKYHWRVVEESLVTFLTSKKIINEYWNKLVSMTEKEHLPFEKPLHDLYKEKYCISPIPSLAIHCTNVNSIYGLSPLKNWKKLWDANKIDL